jgi:hypothetical protein
MIASAVQHLLRRRSEFSQETAMRRISFPFVAIAMFSACSGGDVPIGQVARELQERSDGGPTGNGRTCSWEGTVFQANAADPAGLGQPHAVGDEFASPDGCNDCWCTDRGILCTIRACEEPPTGCTGEGLICPDGSVVGRTGPNCEFSPCPGTPPAPCTNEAMICPDGSSVGRTGPNCEFASCPGSSEPSAPCTADAVICPDGSTLGRTLPGCELPACPGVDPSCDHDTLVCPDGTIVARTEPNCGFPPCPGSSEPPVACDDDALLCPDGSVVGREGPNCEFAPCP